MMAQSVRVTIILIVAVVSMCGYIKAEDWAVEDIYGHTPHVFTQPTKIIDLRFKREAYEMEYKERKKSLKDFGEFAKENLFAYEMLWAARSMYDPNNTKSLFTLHSIPLWFKNMTHWQGCNLAEFKSHSCSEATFHTRFLHPPWKSGDKFKTDFIQHPVSGAATYLFYRAEGFDIPSSALGSFLLSFLFQYTVQGWPQSPDFRDIFVTTAGMGVPLGIVAEVISNLMEKSDSQFIRACSYMLNPTKVVFRDGQISWGTVFSRTIAVQFSW